MSETSMDLTDSGMVAMTRDALAALRTALMRDTGYAAAGYLQEAGYAGGATLFEAFRHWLDARGVGEPEALSIASARKADAFASVNASWCGTTRDVACTQRARARPACAGA